MLSSQSAGDCEYRFVYIASMFAHSSCMQLLEDHPLIIYLLGLIAIIGQLLYGYGEHVLVRINTKKMIRERCNIWIEQRQD